MLPLRYTRRWQAIGICVLSAVLIAAMLPDMWFLPKMREVTWVAPDKVLHASTFAFLTVWFSGQYGRRAYWRMAVGMLAFGALIEIIQRMLTFRDAEVMDLVADVVGISVGLIIALLGAGGWSLRLERWLDVRQSET